MVEDDRPGRPPVDNFQHSNATIVPAAVFIRDGASVPNGPEIANHAEWVAGVMISTDPINAMGVATGANLYASAFIGDGTLEEQVAVAAAHRDPGLGFVSAINNSFAVNIPPSGLDGNSLITSFVDWSAKRYDVFYVQSGRNSIKLPMYRNLPTTSAESLCISHEGIFGVYSLVSTQNDYSENSYSIFNRTFTQLLAPGEDIQLTGLGGIPTVQTGNSFAAPLVTGTVALLQQYGQERFLAGDLKFSSDYQRHEIMKAVLLNSANKIKDDGTRTVNGIPVPVGGFLGMDKTIKDPTNGDRDWLQSEAFVDNATDGLTPLDAHMGAGALMQNALKQFARTVSQQQCSRFNSGNWLGLSVVSQLFRVGGL